MHVSLTESSPVCGVQRLNVSCDHLEVKGREAAGFEPITVPKLGTRAPDNRERSEICLITVYKSREKKLQMYAQRCL